MFELIFHYHKRLESGRYDTEDHTMRKTLGKKEEEVPLEQVASFVASQLARRDIFIVDVEPYEYVKRKVSFKETKDGIVIKNRKFSFSVSGVVDGGITAEEDKPQLVTHVVDKPVPVAPPKPKIKVIREEVFSPDIAGASPIRNLTPGRKYGIIRETDAGNYVVVNDVNMEMAVNAAYFSSIGKGIIFDGPIAESAEYIQGREAEMRNQMMQANKLQYGGEIIPETQDSMQPLRRR
jgi:hypothetical protein